MVNKRKNLYISGIVLFALILFLSIYHFFTTLYQKNEDINTETLENYVISCNYIDNGIHIKIDIITKLNPKIIIGNKTYQLKKTENTIYETDIDLSKLENDTYEIFIKTNNQVKIINKLDQLEQLVRAKFGNKLITFNYENENMSFTIEDFNYEYDILIDPGHGGNDGGTDAGFIKESNLNLIQSLYEKKRFEQHGLTVKLSREDDTSGMMMGDFKEWNLAKLRGYAIGYYGVLAKIVYSNHHNSTVNNYTSGFEILVSNFLDKNELETEINILKDVLKIHPNNLLNNPLKMYSRDIETGDLFDKSTGKTYEYQDYYATIRLPLELFNIKTVTYEGCYMSSNANLNWYYKEENWKKISEIKIKYYVETLGITYIPV